MKLASLISLRPLKESDKELTDELKCFNLCGIVLIEI